MARARNIKPSFFENDILVECSFAARLLFIGLWTLADRAGRLEDRPKRIKMSLFAADDVDVNAELDALARHGFIARYTVDGLRIIQVINFEKHQNPHVREPESDLPGQDNADSRQEQDEKDAPQAEHRAGTVLAPCSNGAGRADSGFRIPDSGFLIPDSGPEPATQSPPAPSRIRDSGPPAAPPDPVPDDPVIVELELHDGSAYPVRRSAVQRWTPAFPAIDVEQQLRRMEAWIQANRGNRKTRRGIERFVVAWLGRAQDNAPRAAMQGAQAPPRSFAETKADIRRANIGAISSLLADRNAPGGNQVIDITPTDQPEAIRGHAAALIRHH